MLTLHPFTCISFYPIPCLLQDISLHVLLKPLAACTSCTISCNWLSCGGGGAVYSKMHIHIDKQISTGVTHMVITWWLLAPLGDSRPQCSKWRWKTDFYCCCSSCVGLRLGIEPTQACASLWCHGVARSQESNLQLVCLRRLALSRVVPSKCLICVHLPLRSLLPSFDGWHGCNNFKL